MLIVLLLCAAPAQAGGTITYLYQFNSSSAAGYDPYVGLALGADGTLYGTTTEGAASGQGAVFSIAPGGALTLLAPLALSTGIGFQSIIVGSDGNIFGTAAVGGMSCLSSLVNSAGNTCGTIVEVTPSGTLTALYQFPDDAAGSYPSALIQGTDGNFYGTTADGGAGTCTFGKGDLPGCGTVFELTPAGVLTTLYSFVGGADGCSPAGLMQGSDGNFYGTTSADCTPPSSAAGSGTLFKITPSGTFTTLYTFPATYAPPSGQTPTSGLVQAPDGNFYGTTAAGGTSNQGTIFRMTPAGDVTVLYSFQGTAQQPGLPTGPLIVGSDGNLYGTSAGGDGSGGNVFQISTSGAYAVVATFPAYPALSGTSGVVEGPDHNLYGTLYEGGSAAVGVSPGGAVFELSGVLTAAPTVALSASPTAITLGQSVALSWSSTGATSCTAGGAWSGNEATSGTLSVTPAATGTATYTLTCSGGGGGATATASVAVSAPAAPAPTVTLSFKPTSIAVGQSAVLTWSSTHATSCTAAGAWSGTEAISGTLTVTPTAAGTSTYTLTCTGAGGSAQASAALTATAAAAAPTVSIAASPSSISVGQSATLTWSSMNATACTASGAWSGSEPTSGKLPQTPAAAGTLTYTLTCTGSGGASAAASASLEVAAAPPASTITAFSGRAGGGSLGGSSLWGLVLLLALRVARARRARRALPWSALAALGLSSLAAAPTASAQTAAAPTASATPSWDQVYVGVRVGSADYRDGASRLDGDIAAAGFGGTSTSPSPHRAGAAVFAGISVLGPLSLEAGYVDMGRYPVGISATSANIASLSQTIARKLWSAGQGATLGLAAPLDFNSWFAIEPRLSLLVFRSKQEVFSPVGTFADDRTGAGFDGGVSLLFHPMGPVYLGAGVDCYDIDGRCSVLLYSGEVSYRFGRH